MSQNSDILLITHVTKLIYSSYYTWHKTQIIFLLHMAQNSNILLIAHVTKLSVVQSVVSTAIKLGKGNLNLNENVVINQIFGFISNSLDYEEFHPHDFEDNLPHAKNT